MLRKSVPLWNVCRGSPCRCDLQLPPWRPVSTGPPWPPCSFAPVREAVSNQTEGHAIQPSRTRPTSRGFVYLDVGLWVVDSYLWVGILVKYLWLMNSCCYSRYSSCGISGVVVVWYWCVELNIHITICIYIWRGHSGEGGDHACSGCDPHWYRVPLYRAEQPDVWCAQRCCDINPAWYERLVRWRLEWWSWVSDNLFLYLTAAVSSLSERSHPGYNCTDSCYFVAIWKHAFCQMVRSSPVFIYIRILVYSYLFKYNICIIYKYVYIYILYMYRNGMLYINNYLHNKYNINTYIYIYMYHLFFVDLRLWT